VTDHSCDSVRRLHVTSRVAFELLSSLESRPAFMTPKSYFPQKIGYSCNLVSNFNVSHQFAAEILQSDPTDDTFPSLSLPTKSSHGSDSFFLFQTLDGCSSIWVTKRRRIHFYSISNFISHRWLGGTRLYVLFQNHTSIRSTSSHYDIPCLVCV
jgi:hypothetical protein